MAKKNKKKTKKKVGKIFGDPIAIIE